MKNEIDMMFGDTKWVFNGDSDFSRYIRDRWKYNFLKTHNECIIKEYFYIHNGSSPSKEISNKLSKILDKPFMKIDDEYAFYGWNDDLFFHNSDRMMKHKFYVCTDVKTHEKLSEFFKNEKKTSELSFYYKDSTGSNRIREVIFSEVINVPSEHYPFLKMDVDKYIEKYFANNSPLLFLQGPPGTGKTTFLKYILTSNHFNAITTYDQSIMESDKFYLDFMFDEEKNIMIVEDADALLSDRKKTTNKSVSKVLNFSDGLAPIKNKKIIFTTNLSSLDDVDPALLRPGRCFDIIKFRTLNLQEANAVCKVHKLNKLKEDRSYSLAEIINKKEDEHNQDNTKFGFF